MKSVAVILAVVIGVTGIVLGEVDNSPGLQLLSGALVVGAAGFGVRIAQRSR
jgi:hypothetical protein